MAQILVTVFGVALAAYAFILLAKLAMIILPVLFTALAIYGACVLWGKHR